MLEKTPERLLDCKEIQPVNPKGNQSWIFIGRIDAEAGTLNTLATWCEELIHWKRPWCWEILKAGGDWDDRGWDGWMTSPTWWTWVWANSGNWQRTGKTGVLQSIGSQRVGHDWQTELNRTTRLLSNARDSFPFCGKNLFLGTSCHTENIFYLISSFLISHRCGHRLRFVWSSMCQFQVPVNCIVWFPHALFSLTSYSMMLGSIRSPRIAEVQDGTS